MGLQARMTAGDPRLYNANRDVAHNFNYVVMEVARRIEAGTWDELTKLAKAHNVSDEELGRACQCVAKFALSQLDVPKESMSSCMARCGFLDLHPTARIVVTAYIGTIVLGMNWAGVHEATLEGEGPLMGYKRLRWHGMRCVKLMSLPWWRRRLYNLTRRVRMAWRAFCGKRVYEE